MSLPAAEELQTWAARALDAARAAGATQAEVGVSSSRALTVNVRKGEVESVEFQRDRDLHLTVYFGRRVGSSSTADYSDAGLRNTVDAACAIARVAGDDPCQGLADASRMASNEADRFPALDLHHPWALDAHRATELALQCEAAGLAADRRISQSDGAGVDSRESIGLYANSHGFVGTRRSTDHSLHCALIAGSGDAMQSGHYYSSARAADDLWTPEHIGREAGQRTAARLGAKTLSTRTAPVLFTAEAARGLIGHFLSAISGGALYRKASFLLDQLDQPVFAPHIQLLQRPFIPRGAGSACWDAEGVTAHERTLVQDGVLRGWLLGSYAARKLGLESTGNAGGAFNVLLPPGEHDADGLRRLMGRGLIVTSLMGQGVNPVTGDYSRGAEGFWVENGEIVHPVQGVTVAGNLRAMLRGIVAVGRDVDTRGAVRTGSLLLSPLTIAGG